jgi:hypothetical protein
MRHAAEAEAALAIGLDLGGARQMRAVPSTVRPISAAPAPPVSRRLGRRFRRRVGRRLGRRRLLVGGVVARAAGAAR